MELIVRCIGENRAKSSVASTLDSPYSLTLTFWLYVAQLLPRTVFASWVRQDVKGMIASRHSHGEVGCHLRLPQTVQLVWLLHCSEREIFSISVDLV